MGTRLPLPEKGHSPPNFWPIFVVAKQLDGRPRPRQHCVRYGPGFTPSKGHSPHPKFCLLWPNGWMDEDPLGKEVDLGPGHSVLDGVPALRERGTAPTLCWAHVYCGHGRPSQLLLSCCIRPSCQLFRRFRCWWEVANVARCAKTADVATGQIERVRYRSQLSSVRGNCWTHSSLNVMGQRIVKPLTFSVAAWVDEVDSYAVLDYVARYRKACLICTCYVCNVLIGN